MTTTTETRYAIKRADGKFEIQEWPKNRYVKEFEPKVLEALRWWTHETGGLPDVIRNDIKEKGCRVVLIRVTTTTTYEEIQEEG